MPAQRFRLQLDATGRGTLFDGDGRPIDGVVAVSIVGRHGQATRVIVEYLAEVDAEVEAAAGLERPPA